MVFVVELVVEKEEELFDAWGCWSDRGGRFTTG